MIAEVDGGSAWPRQSRCRACSAQPLVLPDRPTIACFMASSSAWHWEVWRMAFDPLQTAADFGGSKALKPLRERWLGN